MHTQVSEATPTAFYSAMNASLVNDHLLSLGLSLHKQTIQQSMEQKKVAYHTNELEQKSFNLEQFLVLKGS